MAISKKMAVLGLGKSGMAAVRFFRKRGYEIFTSDTKRFDSNDSTVEELKKLGVSGEWGGHTEKILNSDCILLSPGVNPALPILEKARQRKIPIWPEIEAAYRFCPGPIIAVTGTNGKSTVVALVGHLLKENGLDACVVGNIGIPLLDEIENMSDHTWAVMEVSSFQLETIVDFRPRIASILTITEDHLNRHPDFSTYVAAKARIFENQKKDDWAVLNQDDPIIQNLAAKAKGKILWFGKKPKGEGVFIRGNSIVWSQKDGEKTVATFADFPLPGEHNRRNLASAAAICVACGLPQIKRGIENFKGLPHRLEFVATVDGIDFVDDSKGTNPDAVASALRTFEKPIVLIAGGYDKNLNFKPMVDAAQGRVKALIALGKDNTKILDVFSFLPPSCRTGVSDVKSAVREARKQARSGDLVLLSPGCASFDLFHSAEERGDLYQLAVREFSSKGTA